MKRKVVEFITNLSDGGAENLVKTYALMIDKDKFDISVVTIRNFTNTAVYRTLKDNGVRIIPVYPSWNLAIKVFNKLFGYFYISWRLRTIFEEYGEVIHAHLYTLKYLHRIRNSLKDKQLFYTCHSIPQVSFGGKQSAYAKELHDSNGLRIIALHDDMRKEINEMFGVDDTVVIHNGIDFGRYLSASGGRERVRESLHIPPSSFVLGHVGRFHPVKNHELLVELFAMLSDRDPNMFLLLVGDGGTKKEIAGRLDRHGLQGRYLILSNRTDVPELMQAMDVFVFPSKFEGLGIVLVEAQVSGLRCVVSDAVPDAALLTEQIVKVSLDAPIEKWCEAILGDRIKGTPHGRLTDYDMNNEIKNLEKMYLGEG